LRPVFARKTKKLQVGERTINIIDEEEVGTETETSFEVNQGTALVGVIEEKLDEINEEESKQKTPIPEENDEETKDESMEEKIEEFNPRNEIKIKNDPINVEE